MNCQNCGYNYEPYCPACDCYEPYCPACDCTSCLEIRVELMEQDDLESDLRPSYTNIGYDPDYLETELLDPDIDLDAHINYRLNPDEMDEIEFNKLNKRRHQLINLSHSHRPLTAEESRELEILEQKTSAYINRIAPLPFDHLAKLEAQVDAIKARSWKEKHKPKRRNLY